MPRAEIAKQLELSTPSVSIFLKSINADGDLTRDRTL